MKYAFLTKPVFKTPVTAGIQVLTNWSVINKDCQ